MEFLPRISPDVLARAVAHGPGLVTVFPLSGTPFQFAEDQLVPLERRALAAIEVERNVDVLDLAAPIGTPILASAAGDVIVAKEGGWNAGYGNYVVIQHDNGSETLYAHQSKVVVSQGEHVVQGQVIGYVGTTGKSTGPHVHFEIRDGIRNPF